MILYNCFFMRISSCVLLCLLSASLVSSIAIQDVPREAQFVPDEPSAISAVIVNDDSANTITYVTDDDDDDDNDTDDDQFTDTENDSEAEDGANTYIDENDDDEEDTDVYGESDDETDLEEDEVKIGRAHV